VMVYLDTNCVIYFVEQNLAWLSQVIARFARFRAANDQLVVGDLKRAECLVGPLMTGDTAVEASYRAFFTDPDIRVLPISAAICERAARIRATHKFELVDSLHLATAAEHACGLFLTNDAHLARCTDISVEVLR
jgi:predicted nucleic acid-binding protein